MVSHKWKVTPTKSHSLATITRKGKTGSVRKATPSRSSELVEDRLGCAHPPGPSAAETKPVTTMEEDEDEDNFATFDFESWKAQLPEITTNQEARVGEISSGVARNIKCPTLSHTDNVYKWISAVENYARIVMKMDLHSSHDVWCILAQFSVDASSKDPMMPEFLDRIREYPLPGERQTLVYIPGQYRRVIPGQPKPELSGAAKAKIIKDCWKNPTDPDSDSEDLTSIKASRPIAVWEWLKEFVEKIWISAQRKESFKRTLAELRFDEGPIASDPMIASSRLDTHVSTVKNLLTLAQVVAKDDRAMYLKNTFLGDMEVYEKIINIMDWDKIQEEVKGKIQARHLTVARGEARGNPIVINEIQPRQPRRPFPRAVPRFRLQQQQQQPRNRVRFQLPPRQHPHQARMQRGGTPPVNQGWRAPRNGREGFQERLNCYWCGHEGHRQRYCRSRLAGRPARVPPRPQGVPMAEHIQRAVQEIKQEL